MPFKKVPGTDKFKSPSGKKWSRKAMESYKRRKDKNKK